MPITQLHKLSVFSHVCLFVCQTLTTPQISSKWPFDKTKLSLFLPDKGEYYLARILSKDGKVGMFMKSWSLV